MYNTESLSALPKIGISACLLGRPVRFDGGHRRSDFCCDSLAGHVEYLAICPEQAIGLGTPRPTLRLVEQDGEIIARSRDGRDVSQALRDYGAAQAQQLQAISGYIFCAKSPSCGMERVKVYNAAETGSRKRGIGLYAEQIRRALPLLPLEEDGRLHDPKLRESFITRVYAYQRWQTLAAAGISAAALLAFHRDYKYLLLAHQPQHYRQLGAMLAQLSGDIEAVAARYIALFMHALAQPASRKNHCNVLQHLQGYFKRRLSSAQRRELAQIIEQYRLGSLPLLAPITLLRHYLNEHPNSYLASQYYWQPYPTEMSLRYGF